MAAYLEAFVVAYSDSSFTNPHDVARPEEPRECSGDFTHMGAKYWGFETARHKATTLTHENNAFEFDHDAYHWVKLGLTEPSVVEKITVSTKWFTGNQVPEIAIELTRDHVTKEVVSRSHLLPDQEQEFDIEPTEATECLVRCYHEGGIARISLFGQSIAGGDGRPNLLKDAKVTHISNEHYGSPLDAVNGDRTVDYMQGWESARTGFGESALFHLDSPAIIDEIIVDTYLHRLNSPLSCHVFGLSEELPDKIESHMQHCPRWAIEFEDGIRIVPEDFTKYMTSENYLNEPTGNPRQFTIFLYQPDVSPWRALVSFGRLRPDTWHRFKEMEYTDPVTHLLYMHYPNGGIHGLKVYGRGT